MYKTYIVHIPTVANAIKPSIEAAGIPVRYLPDLVIGSSVIDSLDEALAIIHSKDGRKLVTMTKEESASFLSFYIVTEPMAEAMEISQGMFGG